LSAAARIAASRGIEIVGFEIAKRDATYGFSSDEKGDGFTRFTVFPEAVLEDLSPAEIREAVLEALDELDPDAVAITSYSTPEARSCLQWCAARRRISILMTATKADDAPRRRWRERVKSILLRGYGAAVVGGSPQESYLVDLGFPRDRIFHGYDVVDNDQIAQRVRSIRSDRAVGPDLPGIEANSPFFLVSARMTERKNYPGLLAAYSRYRKRVDNPWPLVALGNGPLRPEVETTIQREAISGITLAGFRPYEDLPYYYANAGAFVHTAHTDQWGLVINEAMAAGLPVLVSTGSGCVTDLVHDGRNGYTFSSRDHRRLAQLMVTVSEDPELVARLGNESKKIISEWHPDRFGRALMDAFDVAGSAGSAHPGLLWRITINAIQLSATTQDSFHTVRP